MDIALVVLRLVAALTEVVSEAVTAYVAGDPTKLRKVQDILPQGAQLKSEETLALERERTRVALGG
jgi:hypothetical protein